jgi:hypothetical protein
MDSKQQVEIIDGVKTAVVYGGDMIIEKITTSNMVCPKLIVPDSVHIKKQYIKHGTNNMNCVVSIQLKISYHITNAKVELKDMENRNFIKDETKKYIKQLRKVIYLMDRLNNSILNEALERVHLLDGCLQEKQVSLQSYKRQKEHAEVILKSRNFDYRTVKKEIQESCRDKVQFLLKENGSKKPASDAYDILVNNDFDISIEP